MVVQATSAVLPDWRKHVRDPRQPDFPSFLRIPRQKKAPDVSVRGSFFRRESESGVLDHLDLVGLHAFLALHGDEGHLLAFLQRLEA